MSKKVYNEAPEHRRKLEMEMPAWLEAVPDELRIGLITAMSEAGELTLATAKKGTHSRADHEAYRVAMTAILEVGRLALEAGMVTTAQKKGSGTMADDVEDEGRAQNKTYRHLAPWLISPRNGQRP